MVQVRGFLLACPSPLPLGAAVLSTPVSCMQLSALLFFVSSPVLFFDTLESTEYSNRGELQHVRYAGRVGLGRVGDRG